MCQRCNGNGVVGPVHINRGDNPHTWEMIRCSSCGGSGYWSNHQAAAARDGEALRQERLARDESLREAAKRMGISPAELSAIEQGRVRSTPEQADD
jgi:hypothetical protein